MLAFFNNEPSGPTIRIGIAKVSSDTLVTVPPQDAVWISAIADTGCSSTCISAGVAQRAGLPIISKGTIQSASHSVPVDIYFGDLWIGARNVGGSTFFWPFRNRVFHELSLPGATYEALLGMDVFQEGMLIVNGPGGQSTFAW